MTSQILFHFPGEKKIALFLNNYPSTRPNFLVDNKINELAAKVFANQSATVSFIEHKLRDLLYCKAALQEETESTPLVVEANIKNLTIALVACGNYYTPRALRAKL